MELGNHTVAVIPARSGSKRVPNKNILEIHGKPIIGWVIETIQETKIFDQVYVSTDSQAYADISISYGAEVPFLRGEDLSDDFTSSDEVIASFIHKLGLPDHASVCCIYPTAFLIEVPDLISSYQVHLETPSSYLLSVVDFPHPIQRALKQLPNHQLSYVYPEYNLARTQDLEKHVYDAGQFYWAKASTWKKIVNNSKMQLVSYKLGKQNYVDIDDLESLNLAVNLHKLRFRGHAR